MNLKNKVFISSTLILVQMFSGCKDGLSIPSFDALVPSKPSQDISMSTQGSVINSSGGLKLSDSHEPDSGFSVEHKSEFSN